MTQNLPKYNRNLAKTTQYADRILRFSNRDCTYRTLNLMPPDLKWSTKLETSMSLILIMST